MKYISIFTFLLLAVLVQSCSSDSETVDESAEGTEEKAETTQVVEARIQDSTGTAVALKIAFVNTDTIMNNYKAFIEANERLKNKQAAEQGRLNQLERKYMAEEKRVQEKLQSGMYTKSWKDTAMQELYMMQMQLQEELSRAQKRMADEMQNINQEQYEIVADLLERYAKENGYHFILSQNAGSDILYGDNQFDVTKEVLRRLNEQYDKKKASE